MDEYPKPQNRKANSDVWKNGPTQMICIHVNGFAKRSTA